MLGIGQSHIDSLLPSVWRISLKKQKNAVYTEVWLTEECRNSFLIFPT